MCTGLCQLLVLPLPLLPFLILVCNYCYFCCYCCCHRYNAYCAATPSTTATTLAAMSSASAGARTTPQLPTLFLLQADVTATTGIVIMCVSLVLCCLYMLCLIRVLRLETRVVALPRTKELLEGISSDLSDAVRLCRCGRLSAWWPTSGAGRCVRHPPSGRQSGLERKYQGLRFRSRTP